MPQKAQTQKRTTSKSNKLVLNARIARRAEVIFRTEEDSKVLVIDTSKEASYFEIDGLAAKVWLCIDGKKSVEDIIKEIKSNSVLQKSESSRFSKDVKKFVQDLYKADLISIET